MPADIPTQDEGVIVGHTRCEECGFESVITMHDPDRFGERPIYQPLLVPDDDICGDCVQKAWDELNASDHEHLQ